jgi:dihydrodipicolinate reductase
MASCWARMKAPSGTALRLAEAVAAALYDMQDVLGLR